MFSLVCRFTVGQVVRLATFASMLLATTTATAWAKNPSLPVTGADASTEADMKPYTDELANTQIKFEMVPIKGGKFTMGSPDDEAGRNEDEGPQHEVEVSPFWIGKYEVTWDEYEVFMFQLDIATRKLTGGELTPLETAADALVRPTKPYTDMTFGMGKERYPAICMTQHAAKKYCQWLSAKTGRFYRLPTEAEWEYACRAGTKTAYSFGDDASKLGDYAWFYENSDEVYHPVGEKKPNPWGLFDMHGNVSEWTADGFDDKFYGTLAGKLTKDPFNVPKEVEPCTVRGGSWDGDPEHLRSAARRPSNLDWKQQDPQIPQSIWYYTDALFNGFRIVRPLNEPPEEMNDKYGFEDTSR